MVQHAFIFNIKIYINRKEFYGWIQIPSFTNNSCTPIPIGEWWYPAFVTPSFRVYKKLNMSFQLDTLIHWNKGKFFTNYSIFHNIWCKNTRMSAMSASLYFYINYAQVKMAIFLKWAYFNKFNWIYLVLIYREGGRMLFSPLPPMS